MIRSWLRDLFTLRPRTVQTRSLLRAKLRMEVLEDRTNPIAAFALSGTNILSFDTANPTVTTSTAITGITALETLVGIDFRPQNGFLYGLGVNATANTGTLYAISWRTGFAGVVGTAGSVAFVDLAAVQVDLPDPATVGYGFDFNPAADRIRVTTGSGLNFRINPNNGAPIDGDATGLTSTPGNGINTDGPITGGTTTVDGTAYTNSFPNNGNATTQYTLDSNTNSLFIQNPPNVGTQTLGQLVTLGGPTLDFTQVNGFDIPASVTSANNTAATSGSAFGVLNVGGTTGLYSINLVNAQATFLGNVGNGTTAVQGFTLLEGSASSRPAIALSADGLNLIRFNTATAGTVATQLINLANLVSGQQLVGIDFRPNTGQLFGLGIDPVANTGNVYIIDPQNGGLTVLGAPGVVAYVLADGTTPVDFPVATAGYGVDFNPTVDRIRVTTETGLNFRIRPDTGAPVDGNTATPATINADGTINGSGSAGVGATAYTNSFGQTGLTSTTQYTLDALSNTLFIQTLPNSGTQTAPLPVTLGGTPLNFDAVNGFDIPASVAVTAANAPATFGFGLAALTVSGTTSLFSINLVTGAAINIGAIGAGTTALAGFTLADAAPLKAISFDDGDADNTVDRGATLTYTVTFSQDIDAATVTTADFNNAGTATITIGTITETGPGIFTVQVTPTTTGTLILRVPAGALIVNAPGNDQVVVPVQDDTTVNVVDVTPPTVTFDDGDTDNAVFVGETLTYTLTFSEDINDASVTAADFNNAGTATITIGTIAETTPGVFTVQVTATSAGSLILRIPTGAVIQDVAGNNLVVPVQDNDTVTVNRATVALASGAAVTVDENAAANTTTITFTRTGPTTSAFEVQLSQTFNDSTGADFTLAAASGGTFNPTTLVFTFAVGSASGSLTFTAVNDIEAEANESVTIALVDGAAYDLGTPTRKIITIGFNDTVVTNTGQFGAGSLKQAIINANAIAGPNTITFEGATFTDATPDALIAVYLQVTETGAANALTIVGPSAAGLTISGNQAFRPLAVTAGAFLNLSMVTIHRGLVPGSSSGGGFLNLGTTVMTQVTLNNNFAPGVGGAIYNAGTLTLNRVTVSTNQANRLGGGIYNTGTLTVSNTTITQNRADLDFLNPTETGGGLGTGNTNVTLRNTIIADNFLGNRPLGGNPNVDEDNIFGTVNVAASNNNLIGAFRINFMTGLGNAGGLTDGTNGNLVNVLNPLLANLGNYGGLQRTHALLPGSLAINAGSNASGGLTDQRGSARLGIIDIGSFESQGFVLAIVAGDNQSAPVRSTYANNLRVRVTANNAIEPVQGGLVTFTRPASGASLTFPTNPLQATISGGFASIIANANSTPGSFDILASILGSNTVTFDLTNV